MRSLLGRQHGGFEIIKCAFSSPRGCLDQSEASLFTLNCKSSRVLLALLCVQCLALLWHAVTSRTLAFGVGDVTQRLHQSCSSRAFRQRTQCSRRSRHSSQTSNAGRVFRWKTSTGFMPRSRHYLNPVVLIHAFLRSATADCHGSAALPR